MSNTIEQYREAKASYLRLRNQAKKDLLSRFQEVANELFRIQRELLEDFGEKVAMPTKAGKGKRTRAAAPIKTVKQTATAAHAGLAASSPKINALKKQLDQQHKKRTAAESAGKPTKTIEDRIYELEDEIRLAQG